MRRSSRNSANRKYARVVVIIPFYETQNPFLPFTTTPFSYMSIEKHTSHTKHGDFESNAQFIYSSTRKYFLRFMQHVIAPGTLGENQMELGRCVLHPSFTKSTNVAIRNSWPQKGCGLVERHCFIKQCSMSSSKTLLSSFLRKCD